MHKPKKSVYFAICWFRCSYLMTSGSVTCMPSFNWKIPHHDDAIKWKHFPRNWSFDGCIDDVTEYLTNTDTRFKSVTLVVGGNDCAARTDPEPVAELVQKYIDMTKEAKHLADDIRTSTVIPRIIDNENVSERIDAVNAGLVSMCHS